MRKFFMRKRIQKKSEVLREGYVKGLRKAQRVIAEMIETEVQHDDEGGCFTTEQIADEVESRVKGKRTRSAWERGVNVYALELADDLRCNYGGERVCDVKGLRQLLLNGARDWKQFSYGGCSLAYDLDIAKRLCNPSELKMTRNAEREPNSRETWLDVQARALHQAAVIVNDIFNDMLGR